MSMHFKRGIAPVAVLVIVLLVAGAGTVAVKEVRKNKVNKERAQVETPANDGATSTPATIQVKLQSQNNSGESGQAVLTEVDGKTKVIVNLTGKPSTVAQPAHIHLSSCATIGAVKYPLTSVSKGASQTMLDVSLSDLLKGLPLSINVHKSAAESGVYVACGDITVEKATSTKSQ